MKTIITVIIAITCAILIGCDDKSVVECQAPTDQELETVVKGNSLTLLDAVELFAIDNYGEYPANADSDTTISGKVLIDYLPGGERLLNPYTGIKDQPMNSVPLSPGEIGYYKYHRIGDRDEDYYLNVYFIKGYGTNSIIIEHDNIEETEALVVEDCMELQRIVEAWREDNTPEYYPYSYDDTNDRGWTVFDYLPDGQLMKNRFTMFSSEPSVWGGSAFAAGMIGYDSRNLDGVSVGYTITGVGFEAGDVIFSLTVN